MRENSLKRPFYEMKNKPMEKKQFILNHTKNGYGYMEASGETHEN